MGHIDQSSILHKQDYNDESAILTNKSMINNNSIPDTSQSFLYNDKNYSSMPKSTNNIKILQGEPRNLDENKIHLNF